MLFIAKFILYYFNMFVALFDFFSRFNQKLVKIYFDNQRVKIRYYCKWYYYLSVAVFKLNKTTFFKAF